MSSFDYNLQIFADAAEGAAAEATTGTVSETVETRVESPATGEQQAQERTPFKELVRGDYKQDFENAVKKRIKGVNTKLQEAEDRYKKVTPVFEKLALKYGISDPGDVDSILAQIDKDNSYYENFALERGITVEQARTVADAERIIRQNEIQQQEAQQRQMFNDKMNSLIQQGEALKQKYPSFDLDTEMQNEQFRRLVFNDVPVEGAFTVLHKDEIMSGAMAYAYNQSQQDFANTQRANAGRPIENGMSAQQAAHIDDDMTKLSKEQREKINAAVRRGEKVTPENFRDYL